MTTNEKIFELYESVDKYGEIAVYRLERYGHGSRFGSKFAGSEIKNGLHQGAGIYVFSDLNRMKEYVHDEENNDDKKPDKGKLCQKLILDKNEISYPKIQFDLEVMLGFYDEEAGNWFGKFLTKYVTKNMDQLNTKKIVDDRHGLVFLKPGFLYNGKQGISVRSKNNTGGFSVNFEKGDVTSRGWQLAEQLVQHLADIDPSFLSEYNGMLLKSLTKGTGYAYRIVDPSIIKNKYYFYADSLFHRDLANSGK